MKEVTRITYAAQHWLGDMHHVVVMGDIVPLVLQMIQLYTKMHGLSPPLYTPYVTYVGWKTYIILYNMRCI